MLERSEKEKAVIELCKNGKTVRETVDQLNISSRDVCSIRKKEEERKKNEELNSAIKTDEGKEERNKVQISKASQVLNLFCEGKKSVEVAIELDMQIAEVDRMYKVYSESNGLYNFNQVYEDIKKSGSISSYVKLYQTIKQEGMGMQQVVDLLKISQEMPYLEAKYQQIKDDIDNDGPKVLELIKQKLSFRDDIQSMLEELPSFRSYVDNELKHEQEKLEKQKAFLASEVDKYIASLANEVNKCKECAINEINNSKECLFALKDAADKLKSIQKEEQRLTSRIELLKNDERQEKYVQRPQKQPQELGIQSWSEAQRRRKQQEQFIQEPQALYLLRPQHPGQQETPNLLDKKQGDPAVEQAKAIFLNQIRVAGQCQMPTQ